MKKLLISLTLLLSTLLANSAVIFYNESYSRVIVYVNSEPIELGSNESFLTDMSGNISLEVTDVYGHLRCQRVVYSSRYETMSVYYTGTSISYNMYVYVYRPVAVYNSTRVCHSPAHHSNYPAHHSNYGKYHEPTNHSSGHYNTAPSGQKDNRVQHPASSRTYQQHRNTPASIPTSSNTSRASGNSTSRR